MVSITKRTNVGIVRGFNNGSVTYLWNQVSGPATPVISTPTELNTDIVFDTYAPGLYQFQLTVTTEGSLGLTVTGLAYFVIQPTIAPRITSGNSQVTYPDELSLSPQIDDDGWGGGLNYTWTQISGPGSATITPQTPVSAIFDPDIFDPVIFAPSTVTNFAFPALLGTYIFKLTVTRDDDSLVGSGYWRVTVFTSAVYTAPTNTGNVSMTANGVAMTLARVSSVRISKPLGSKPTCMFTLDGTTIQVFNEVILSRGGIRLFGGICLSIGTAEEEHHVFFTPNLVGYAWHFGRKTVTRAYDSISITAIVLDLLSVAPGGITDDYVAADLPNASIAFTDTYIDDALDELARLIHAHWKVDDYKKLHFAVVEEQGDPLAISPQNPWYRALSIVRDGSQLVNRIIIHHTVLGLPSENPVATVYSSNPNNGPAFGVISSTGEVRVSSLDGYSITGGDVQINGQSIHYTSIIARQLTGFAATALTFRISGIEVTDGQLASDIGYTYYATLSTPFGETHPVWGVGSPAASLPGTENAWKIKLTSIRGVDTISLGPGRLQAININLISNINIYRMGTATIDGIIYTGGWFIGTISPKGGSVIDDTLLANKDLFPVQLPLLQTDGEEIGFFLTGCIPVGPGGSTDSIDSGSPASSVTTVGVDSVVVVEDIIAQAALAVQLGGGDTGIIEISLQAGIMTREEAIALGTAFLNDAKEVRNTVTVIVRDDDCHPGQVLSINQPASFSITDDLKIQQVLLSGFIVNDPHEYVVTASKTRVTLEDLLKHNLSLKVTK